MNPAGLRAFHEHLRARNLTFLVWSAIFFNAVVLTWSYFDWLLAPHLWRQFLLLRLGGTGLNSVVIFVIHRSRFRRLSNEGFVVWLLSVGVAVVAMLYQVEAAFVPYMLGFATVVLAVGILPLWHPYWAVASVLMLLGLLPLGSLFGDLDVSARDLTSGLFYVGTMAVGGVMTAGVKYLLARREWFALQELHDERGLTERLLAADRMKDEFLANVSHELRTPLNGIIGLSDSMLDADSSPSIEQQRQHLEMISASGRRLANLVNEILDFARLKNRELVLTPAAIDVRHAADAVLAMMQPLARDKGLTLRTALPESLPFAWADDDRLQQILLNLVGNAIKFTPSGWVEIHGSAVGSHIAIGVRDTGIGIPVGRQEAIFESFEQADASISREYGGTGLGLAITKKLVELQGGSISVESLPGSGSNFVFTLPQAEAPSFARTNQNSGLPTSTATTQKAVQLPPRAHVEKSVPSPPSINEPELPAPLDLGPVNLLAVDDEPINLQVISSLLRPHGYNLRTCHSGMEAAALLQSGEYRPDLILLDVMMPKMSGYELLAKLRENRSASELPIILLTAKNQVTDLIAGFEAGANDYLTKPIVKGELLSRLKTHLHLARLFNAYGRFVPHEFIRHLARNSVLDVKLGDQVQKEMAILFSDIRSFTSLSEGMNPRENFNFLNSFLSRVAPVIAEHRGFIDQYIGDAVMALFPLTVDDAVSAAASLRRAVREYNSHRQNSGYRPIGIGTGVHVGPLILGTIGYERRMQTTVISDSVNQASRLEGLTKYFGLDVLLSDAVVNRLANQSGRALRSLGRIRVKGKKQSVSVYELLEGAAEEELDLKMKTRSVFEAGVEHLSDGQVIPAIAAFAEVLKIMPQDSAAQRLLERATYLLEHPEARSQDGELIERRS